MSDQFLLYDQALVTWLTNDVAVLLPEVTTQILIATPRRAFADVMSGKIVNNETLTLPRMSVSRLDVANDPSRFNSNRLRKLGRVDQDRWKKIRSAKFPTPINISYQIDLWSKRVEEMNVWIAKFLTDFASTYKYLSITPNDIYGAKTYPNFMESIADTSELNPGSDDRLIRKSIGLKTSCWLFDESIVNVNTIRKVVAEFRDTDTDDLYTTVVTPPIETVGVGTGAQTVFSFTLNRPPILLNTILIRTLVGAVGVVIIDDNIGNLYISGEGGIVGTIDYNTGAVNITYPITPNLSADIEATYFTDLS